MFGLLPSRAHWRGAVACFLGHSMGSPEREVCGLIMARGERVVYCRCHNAAAAPERSFRIDPGDYNRHIRNGRLLAICHSHPAETGPPEPSQRDLAGHAAGQAAWLIASGTGDLTWLD